MNKFKIALWLVFIGFLGLVIYQNQEYFLTEQSLDINLWVDRYSTMPIPNILFFAGCFVAGFLIAYFLNLLARFKASNTIRTLTAELETLRSGASATGEAAAAKTQTAESVETEAPVTEPKEEMKTADTGAAAEDLTASPAADVEEKTSSTSERSDS